MVSVNGCHDKSFPVRGSIRNEPFMVIGDTPEAVAGRRHKGSFLKLVHLTGKRTPPLGENHQ